MSFRSAKSRLEIYKDGDMGRPRAKVRATLGRVGGTRRCQQRLLESDRNWQESDTSSERPAPRKGGGGFKGKRLMPPTPQFKKH